MKRILITIIILLIAASLVACTNPMEAAISQAIENNNAEESASDGSSSSSDSQMDVNISDDGNSITISGDDGETTIQGNDAGMAWPGDKLPASIPELSGVTVVMVMDTNGGILIGFENCDQSIADSYVSKLKGDGWEASMEINSEDGYTSWLTKGNESIQLTWSSSDGSGSFVYAPAE